MKQAFDNFFGGNKLSWSLGEEMIFTGMLFVAVGIICALVYATALIIELKSKNKRRR